MYGSAQIVPVKKRMFGQAVIEHDICRWYSAS